VCGLNRRLIGASFCGRGPSGTDMVRHREEALCRGWEAFPDLKRCRGSDSVPTAMLMH